MGALLIFWCSNRGALPGACRRVVRWDIPKHGPVRQVGLFACAHVIPIWQANRSIPTVHTSPTCEFESAALAHTRS
jgi:hypothetical protein